MYTLSQTKFAIQMTDCKQFLVDGLSLSEPIITQGEDGLIDNFFMFSTNEEMTELSKPLVIFGIYTDAKTTAYVQEVNPFEDKIYTSPIIPDPSKVDEAYEAYEALYPEVKRIAYSSL